MSDLGQTILNYPLLVFAITLFAMWLAAKAGTSYRGKPRLETEWKDWDIVAAATLTLLGLIIGFTFSMAISHYDLRKNYEAQEANAIGTEYVRAELLSAADAAKVQGLLRNYLGERVLYYEVRFRPLSQGRAKRDLAGIASDTAQLQGQMWSVVRDAAAQQPTPPVALVVAGMNEVLDSQGYTQAAWDNRLPVMAWVLMVVIAIFSNWLVGYGAHHSKSITLVVLPLILGISFFLIADIDSPRGGLIRVHPENLIALAQSLRPH